MRLIIILLIMINCVAWGKFTFKLLQTPSFKSINQDLIKEYKNLNLDIVHIDVGNSISYNGPVLFYPKTYYDDFYTHGTHITSSFYNELKKLGLKNIVGRQIVIYYDGFNLNTEHLLEALEFIQKLNVKIVSYSIGGTTPSFEEQNLIENLTKKNIIFLAAAGNNYDKELYYPAAYKNDCLISVGSKVNRQKSNYSNKADVYIEEDDLYSGTSISTAKFGAHVLKNIYNKSYNCKDVKTFLIKEYKL